MMIQVKFKYDDIILNGVILASYTNYTFEPYYKKKFIFKYKCFKKNKYKSYLIFVPFKHYEKTILEINEKDIIEKKDLSFEYYDDNYYKYVDIEKYRSTYIDDIYESYVDIEEFSGYSFIYEDQSFIANFYEANLYYCLNLLYKKMPFLANLDLDNNSE